MELRFDADSFLRFQQLQANAAAGSAAHSESKPKHVLTSSAASFPAKGFQDDSMQVQRGPKIPRHNHENHKHTSRNFLIFCFDNIEKFPMDKSLKLYTAQQEAGASYLVIDSESGNLADLSLDHHTRPFVSKDASRPRIQR
jgi:hypothetical protein